MNQPVKYFEISFHTVNKTINFYELEAYEPNLIAEEEAYQFLDEIVGESNVSKEDAIAKINDYLSNGFNQAFKNYMSWREVYKKG